MGVSEAQLFDHSEYLEPKPEFEESFAERVKKRKKLADKRPDTIDMLDLESKEKRTRKY